MMVLEIRTFNGTGADASGSSGDSNRVLTLANTQLTVQNGFLVYVSGLALSLTVEYTVVHNTTGTQITFLNALFDDMTVVVSYQQDIPTQQSNMSHKLVQALNRTIDLAGTQLRVRYFDMTPGSVWDDEVTLSKSGTDLWTSGVIMPLRLRDGSSDSILVKEGKLINSDQRLYVNGSLLFNGSTQSVDIQLGSPSGDLFTTITDGGISWTAEANPVYKIQFIRRLTGSLT